MCLGQPMQVVSLEGEDAICLEGEHRHTIDVRLVTPVAVGDWVLTFLGAARAKLTETEAHDMTQALKGVAAAMTGADTSPFFADIIAREPELPPHMQAALKAGKATA